MKKIDQKKDELIAKLKNDLIVYAKGYKVESWFTEEEVKLLFSALQQENEPEKSAEEILYKFRTFFNDRYEPLQNRDYKIEILNIDVRDFINSNSSLPGKEPSKVSDDCTCSYHRPDCNCHGVCRTCGKHIGEYTTAKHELQNRQ